MGATTCTTASRSRHPVAGEAALGADAPYFLEPEPFLVRARPQVDVDGLGAVVFTAGFRPDYARWVRLPVFDPDGFPETADDLATAVPGLYFCGVHFLRNRRSSLLWGVGDDARIVVQTILDETSRS